jgi:glucose-1-phosphate adenylyltransferase
MKKKIVCMLLAGGQGSRLGILTSNMAKPAVPFGGKYRIIDFPLSNCVNSDIDTVGVLTQYRPLALNAYLGTGQHWDLDRSNGGVFVLPPYMTEKSGRWYSGTANAIWQNREFIDQYDPDYVLILSGDHIYKMDYTKMLKYHVAHEAAATIAVLKVPMEEAHRFGIMNTDAEGNIVSFEEKPKNPKSNNASMGIYIFNWKLLRDYMERDDNDPSSENDFGKNIIPSMLNAGEKMVAYPFEGYWKDVGTIQSLWEANMDLLGKEPILDLNDPAWRIYTRNPVMPPHYTDANASITNSLVTEGCVVRGTVQNTVLFCGAKVGAEAQVLDSVIFPNAEIGNNCSVKKAIIGENAVIGDNVQIGVPLREGETVDNRLTGDVALIGIDVKVPAGTVIPSGAVVTAETLDHFINGGAEA